MSKIRMTLAVSALAVVLCLALVPSNAPSPTPPPAPSSAVSSGLTDSRDDVIARRNYQLQRLADPATGRIPPDIHRLEQEFASLLPRRVVGPNGEKAVADWDDQALDARVIQVICNSVTYHLFNQAGHLCLFSGWHSILRFGFYIQESLFALQPLL